MKKIGGSELPTVPDIDTVLKQHTRNKRFVFVIIVILVLGYLLIYFVNTNAEASLDFKRFQCSISIGENRDLCFLDLSEKAEDIDFCNGINGKWTRDYCYLEYNQCEFIDDFNLQYQCKRVDYRPYILGFISKPSDVSEDTFVNIGECIELKGYNRLNCIYNQALYISKENFTAGAELCKQFENELYSGECEYFLVLSLMPDLSINTDETISYVLDYCKDIKNPSWRSECYFLLADEISYLPNSNDYDYEIVLACSLSDKSHPYACISHVVINPLYKNISETNTFCESIPEKFSSQKIECYVGLGSYSIKQDYNDSFKSCNLIDIKYLEDCMKGELHDLALNSKISLIQLKEMCDKSDNQFMEICYNYIGMKSVFQKRENNLFDLNNACEDIPNEYKKECYNGIGKFLDILTRADLSKSIEMCTNFNATYINDCLSGILDNIGRYKESEQDSVEICNYFPEEFHNTCRNEIKGLLKRI